MQNSRVTLPEKEARSKNEAFGRPGAASGQEPKAPSCLKAIEGAVERKGTPFA